MEDHPSNNKSKTSKASEDVSSTTPNSSSLYDSGFDIAAADSSFNTSEMSSISPPIRSDSAQSNTEAEVANMVYQLPPLSIGNSNMLGESSVTQQHFHFNGMEIQAPGSPTLSHISSGSGSSSASSEIDNTKNGFDLVSGHSNEDITMGSSQTIYNLPNIHTLRNVDWSSTWQPQE